MHKLATVAASAAFCLTGCSSTQHHASAPHRTPGALRSVHMEVAEQKRHLQRVADTGAAIPALQWQWINPLPSADGLNSIAYGVFTPPPGRTKDIVAYAGGISGYIAVGDDGSIYRSTDAATWARQVSGHDADGSLFIDAIYADGQFVVGGLDLALNHSFFVKSSDGVNWTPAGSLAVKAEHLAYGNGVYVAATEVAATSSDLQTWTTHTIRCAPSPTCSDYWFAPVFGANRFVVLGMDYYTQAPRLYSSADGQTWVPGSITLSADSYLLSMAWNGSVFVAVGYDATCEAGSCGLVYMSTDGMNWTAEPRQGGSGGMSSCRAAGGKFYAVSSGQDGSSYVYTSTDGITWISGSAVTGPIPQALGYHPSVASPSGFIGAFNENTPLTIVRSPDYATWTATSLSSGSQQQLSGVVNVNHHFIAMGPGALSVSDDASHWTAVSTGAINYTDLAWNGTNYIAVGNFTAVSGDLLHWLPLPGGLGNATGVACNGGNCVQVGLDGSAMITSNGINWQAVQLGTMDDLAGVVWNGTRMVAVAGIGAHSDGIAMFVSTDGLHWAPVAGLDTPGQALMFEHIRWTGSELVAVGGRYSVAGSGKIQGAANATVVATSADGLAWDVHVYDPSTAFEGAPALDAVNAGALYVLSDAGLYVSNDGADAVRAYFPISAHGSAIASDGDSIVVVGGNAILHAHSGAPLALPGAISVQQGSGSGDDLSFQVKAMPPVGHEHDSLIYMVVTQPQYGTVRIDAGGNVLYHATGGYHPQDNFTYRVIDAVSGLTSSPAPVVMQFNQ